MSITRKPALATLLLLAAGAVHANARIEVVFEDPTASYAAYYADIERVTVAAGGAWLASFQALATAVDLTVRIGFADIATASGSSLTSAYIGTGSDGIDLYHQGAAYELMTGIDVNGALPDIAFSLGINGYLQGELWFDPAPALRLAAVPVDRTDAMSLLLHEFGHAFGFNGWRDAETGALPGNYQSTFDALISARASAQGTTLMFTGATSEALYGAALPLTWGRYGHLGNAVEGVDLLPDLMNGIAFDRGTRYAISALDLAVMQDLGLPVQTLVPEPAAAALWAAGLALLAARGWRQSSRRHAGATATPSALLPLAA